MDQCNHCQQELIVIDNRGERLTGCLLCNLWSVSGEKLWIELDSEDVAHARQELRRAKASKKMPQVHRSSS
jgi:hypothetical protein